MGKPKSRNKEGSGRSGAEPRCLRRRRRFYWNPPREWELVSQLHRENVLRPPDWRWWLAQWSLRGNPYLPVGWLDHWVAYAVRYLRAYRQCEGHPGRLVALRKQFPDLSPLHHFWLYPESPDAWKFTWAELYLLAGASPRRIAEITGWTWRQVFCYERLFFDVATRLEFQLLILRHVIGVTGDLIRGYQLDGRQALQVMAYFGGETLLDRLFAAFQEQLPLPDSRRHASLGPTDRERPAKS